MANAVNTDWDAASPPEDEFLSNLPREIRMAAERVKYRLDKEHNASATSGAGGEHKAGSAISYYQSVAPTLRPDGVTVLSTDDSGRLWVDTTNSQRVLKIYVGGTGWSTLNLSGYVDLTTNQTVAGVKTFSSMPIFPGVGGGLVPAGVILPFGGATAPSGWLLCYGQAVSRAAYANLFTSISTTFGIGNGTTTFNVPDMRGRMPLGKDNMGGSSANRVVDADADTVGNADGAETVTLTTAQIPAHTHPYSGGYADDGDSAGSPTYPMLDSPSAGTTSFTFAESGGGTGGAHDNMPPFMTLNYIIKT